MTGVLAFAVVALFLLLFLLGLERIRYSHPIIAGAMFGAIGTIPTLWLLENSLPSTVELVVKMLLSGCIWAALFWMRTRGKRERKDIGSQRS